MVRRRVWMALAITAVLSGCGGEPAVGFSTVLPIDGDNGRVLYAMCSDILEAGDTHIKITYIRGRERIFTVVPYCEDVVKKYAKYR